MTGPIRTKTASEPRHEKAPRPPNSWIIYRSDKMHELLHSKSGATTSIGGGAVKRSHVTQADISKIISEMWRNESDVVRQEYERRAEIKKAEHFARFPNYRFQPMKKSDRAKEKASRAEEERIGKQAEQAQHGQTRRAKTTATSSPPKSMPSPPLSTPSTPVPAPRQTMTAAVAVATAYTRVPSTAASASSLASPVSTSSPSPALTTSARRHLNDAAAEDKYGPCGPSPPCSAASTPYHSPVRTHVDPSSTTHEAVLGQGYPLPSAAAAFNRPHLYPSSSTSSPVSELRLPFPGEDDNQPQQLYLQPDLDQHQFWNPDSANNNNNNSFTSFTPVSDQELQNWNFGDMTFLTQLDNGATSAFDIGPTLAPGTLTLTPHSSNALVDFPDGNVHFQMGIIPQVTGSMSNNNGVDSGAADLFSGFDWSQFNLPGASFPSPADSGASPASVDPREVVHAPIPVSSSTSLAASGSNNAFAGGFNLFAFTDHAESPTGSTAASPPSSFDPHQHSPPQTDTITVHKYAPPSGAGQSHVRRRAGGTWKPPQQPSSSSSSPTTSSRQVSQTHFSS